MLWLSLLGGLHIARGADAARPDPADRGLSGFVSHKAQALLVYLAMNPRPQPRDTLAGLLWGEMPQARASGNLRVVLSNLRDLAPEHIRIEREQVAFDLTSPHWLDVAEFTALTNQGDAPALHRAVELYRGDFLEGFYLRDAPAFEEWMLIERERLRRLMFQVLHRLTRYHSERGEYAAGIAAAERLLALDPWREEAHRDLMRLLALTGQRSAALAQYEQCRRMLAAELGVSPLEETTVLVEQIKAQVVMPTLPTPSVPTLPFAGRAAEHARLVDWWTRLCRGRAGSLLLVEGEAGVGKTRLVEEALRYIEGHGGQVARGRCYEFGEGLPYQPIAAALRDCLRRLPQLPDRLGPSWRAELAHLLPEWTDQAPPTSAATGGPDARLRLFEAVARALTAPSPPTALFLDDLHWADPSTLDLLHYLVRWPDAPIGVVAAYRPEEVGAGHPLTRLRQGLSRDHQAERLCLARLPGEAVAEIARALVGDAAGDSLGAFLQRESDGNPFILVETVHALHEQGALRPGTGEEWEWISPAERPPLPTSVQDVILQRVERMSARAQELLALAAVFGRPFDLALLRSVAGTAEAAEPALEEWVARRLVAPLETAPAVAAPSFDFTHDKIRAVVYQATPAPQRALRHRQVAEALERMPPAFRDEQSGWLAHHWEQAGDAARAVDYLLRAGDRARLLYADQEAGAYYRRALAYLEQQGDDERAAQTWMRLGLTYHNAFDFAAARRAYDAGCALWRRSARSAPASPAQTLRVRWEEPLALDPLRAPDAHTSELMAHLFSGLVQLNPETDVAPDVAHSWDISADGRTLTFHLRRDARWSDGTPVTAEDFEYAWRRALDPAHEPPAIESMREIRGAQDFNQGSGRWDQVGVHARDPHTLVIELSAPCGYFLYLLARTPYYPVPRHVVEAHGDAWSEVGTLVTNGPFTVERWERGRCLVLARHEGYHGPATGNLQRVEAFALAEPAARLAWYAADALDVLGITYFVTEERENARRRYADEYISVPMARTSYLVFDVRQPPLDDERVRQALALATDRQVLANDVLQGAVSPAEGGLVPPGVPGHTPGIALPYRPERARHLLAEAGYPQGRGFPPLRALACRAAETYSRYLHAQWREQLGVEIAWDVLEWPDFLARLRQGLPAIFLATWVADYPDPDNLLRVSRNDHWRAWQHAGYDALVEQARYDLDQSTRLARYAQAERILAQAAPILPLAYERDHLLLKPRVRRYPMSGIRSTFWKDVRLAP